MKKNKTFFWIATIILILWEGVMPLGVILFARQYATIGSNDLGYPEYFGYTLIICKVLGVIAISVPTIPGKIKEWAYAGLSFNLIFASISHMCVDQNIGYILMPLAFLAILAVSYRHNDKLPANN
ncbi:MAG: DoxX family protein [Sphingobacteriaceae bacterium]|nr:MAG: DoxX family protein [Sphingobacteriaceae bacterium]